MYVQMTKMYHILATKGKYTIAIDFIFFKWKANPPPYCANFHTVASSPTVPSRPALTPSLLRSCSTSLGVHGPAGGLTLAALEASSTHPALGIARL